MDKLIFGYNMKKASELELDLVDLCILRWFDDLPKYGDNNYEIINGEFYYLIKYDQLIKDIPIIYVKKSAVYKKLQVLAEKKILKKILIKKCGQYNYYAFDENYCLLLSKSEAKNSLEPLDNIIDESMIKDCLVDFSDDSNKEQVQNFIYGSDEINDAAQNFSYVSNEINDDIQNFNYGSNEINDDIQNFNYGNDKTKDQAQEFNNGREKTDDHIQEFNNSNEKIKDHTQEFNNSSEKIKDHIQEFNNSNDEIKNHIQEFNNSNDEIKDHNQNFNYGGNENNNEYIQKYNNYSPINNDYPLANIYQLNPNSDHRNENNDHQDKNIDHHQYSEYPTVQNSEQNNISNINNNNISNNNINNIIITNNHINENNENNNHQKERRVKVDGTVLAFLLYQRIKWNYQELKKPDMMEWIQTIDKFLKEFKVNPLEFVDVIRWVCSPGNFWMYKIITPEGIIERYGELVQELKFYLGNKDSEEYEILALNDEELKPEYEKVFDMNDEGEIYCVDQSGVYN